VLQCVAVCCCVMQHVAVDSGFDLKAHFYLFRTMLGYVAVYCEICRSVLCSVYTIHCDIFVRHIEHPETRSALNLCVVVCCNVGTG